jgi:hypothetical protein
MAGTAERRHSSLNASVLAIVEPKIRWLGHEGELEDPERENDPEQTLHLLEQLAHTFTKRLGHFTSCMISSSGFWTPTYRPCTLQ